MNKAIGCICVPLVTAIVAGCMEGTDKSTNSSERAGSPEGHSRVAAIRVMGVAEPLSLPAPKGANRILTATVTGGTATSVWLADSAASSTRVPLVPVGDGEYQVNLYSEEVHDALRAKPNGEFRVFAELTDGALASSIPVRYSIKASPVRLAFPWDKATMTVYQRSTKEIPGSDGLLRLRLGDITAGHVLVSVSGPDRQSVLDMRPMREGEAIPISLEQARYILVLEKLVNLLTGRDYATFCVMSEGIWEREKIDRLLKVIESADVAFIREGEEMTGVAFAARLRLKLEYASPTIASLDEFVDQIASQSWTSGKPYQVKLENGDISEAADWLQKQAKEITCRTKGNRNEQKVPTSGPAGTTSVYPPSRSREYASERIPAIAAADVVGEYYFGDGLGVNCVLKLSEDGTFLFTWRGCLGKYDENEGPWRMEKGLIVLEPSRPNVREGFRGTATRLYPIPWAERLYLVSEDQMIDFCHGIPLDWAFDRTRHNRGRSAFFYLRRGDEDKPLEGMPVVPLLYARYLKEPFRGTVLKTNEDDSFVIDRGRTHGVVVGTKLKLESGDTFGYRVTQVDRETSACVARSPRADPDVVRPGTRVRPFLGG